LGEMVERHAEETDLLARGGPGANRLQERVVRMSLAVQARDHGLQEFIARHCLRLNLRECHWASLLCGKRRAWRAPTRPAPRAMVRHSSRWPGTKKCSVRGARSAPCRRGRGT